MLLHRRLPALLAVAVVLATAATGTAPAAAAESDTDPGTLVHGKSYLVVDVSTGAILAAKAPHRRLRPASTLKTLTALTLLPRLDKRQEYTVQWEDAAVEGSAVGIVPDATYTVDDLFYGLLLPSGNDAAHALANAAGGIPSTVRLMQEQAEAIGAQDTTVRNPSGLDAPGQYTSAYDLALFARADLRRRDFRRYVGTVTTAFPAEMPKRPGQHRKTYQIYNQNPLVLYGYPGAVGVKTGYTTLAGRTFVGAAERRGHLLLIVMMDYIDSTEVAAPALLNWGFAHLDAEPVGYLVGRGHPDTQAVARTALAGTTTAATTTAGPSLTTGWHGIVAAGLALVGLAALVLVLGVVVVRRGQGSSASLPGRRAL